MKGFIITLVVAILSIVIVVVLMVKKNEGDASSFAGVYIRHVQHEFGTEWDTLVIQQIEASTRYKILRRWKYERVMDGNMVTPEYKQETTIGQWLEREKLLVEEESAQRYTLKSNGRVLLVGTTEYERVKEIP